MYIVLNKHAPALMLCVDRKWRSVTPIEFILTYRTARWARSMAQRCGGIVAHVPRDHTLDASGTVWPPYDNVRGRPLSAYVRLSDNAGLTYETNLLR